MSGEKDLSTILRTMRPELQPGEYVFCTVKDLSHLSPDEVVFFFKEREGISVVVERGIADRLGLDYSFIAGWITLTVHSSLEAVGLTAAFSKALSDQGISCNVVAAFYHDHIFIDIRVAEKAMGVLEGLAG